MDRILEYRVKVSDIEATVGGILGKVLKKWGQSKFLCEMR